MKRLVALLLLCVPVYAQSTQAGGFTITNIFDASGAATLTAPYRRVASDPATCDAGKPEFYWNTTTLRVRFCESTNVWSDVGSGAVNSGTGGYLTYYAVTGTSVSGLSSTRWNGTTEKMEWYNSGGTKRAEMDVATGLLTEGIGITTGFQKTLGNAGDTGRSSLTIHDGNTAALPPYVEMFDHLGNRSALFPCGALAGRWCQDSVIPGAAYTNPLMSTTSTDTFSNKTAASGGLTKAGYTTWTEIATPVTNPAAGFLRVYAKSSAICWLNSAGTEQCAGSTGSTLADPGSNGMVARTALNTTAARTITGATNEISVTNGDGVAGNPTVGTAVAAGQGTANQGGYWMGQEWGQATGVTNPIAKRHFVQWFLLPVKSTFGRLSFEVTTVNSTSCDGAGTCGLVFRIWGADGSTVIATSNVLTTELNTLGIKTVTLTSAVTVPAGAYFFAWGSDSGNTLVLRGLTIVSTLPPIISAVSPRIGFCENPMVGDHATLAFPSSCGAITASAKGYPAVFLEP